MASTAYITGAARGIGRAFALRLASQGRSLVLVDILQDELEALGQQIRDTYSVQVKTVIADLTSKDQVRKLAADMEESPDLDLLVNNAAMPDNPLFNAEVDHILEVININAVAPALLCRAAIRSMRPRKKGAIINVASLGGIVLYHVNENYGATKSYLITLSKLINRKARKNGIHVQALCPGLTDTDINTPQSRRIMPRILWMSADAVAECSLKSLLSRRDLVVPGLMNKTIVLAHRLGLLPLYFKAIMIMTRIGLLKTPNFPE